LSCWKKSLGVEKISTALSLECRRGKAGPWAAKPAKSFSKEEEEEEGGLGAAVQKAAKGRGAQVSLLVRRARIAPAAAKVSTSKNVFAPSISLGWRQDNGNRSNQESKFDFLAIRQCLVKIDEGQQKIKIVRTNRQSNLQGSCQSIFSLCRHHPSISLGVNHFPGFFFRHHSHHRRDGG